MYFFPQSIYPKLHYHWQCVSIAVLCQKLVVSDLNFCQARYKIIWKAFKKFFSSRDIDWIGLIWSFMEGPGIHTLINSWFILMLSHIWNHMSRLIFKTPYSVTISRFSVAFHCPQWCHHLWESFSAEFFAFPFLLLFHFLSKYISPESSPYYFVPRLEMTWKVVTFTDSGVSLGSKTGSATY